MKKILVFALALMLALPALAFADGNDADITAQGTVVVTAAPDMVTVTANASVSGRSVADAQDGARTEYKKSAKKREDGMVQSQKLLLTWLTNSPALFPKVQRYVGADDFTDPICHSVAKMLFEQYEKGGTVNPARIISTYEDEEQQREAAGILNATIHRVDTREEREKALRETVIRVRENSINHKLANTFDVQEMAALAKEKNELPGTVHIPLEE